MTDDSEKKVCMVCNKEKPIEFAFMGYLYCKDCLTEVMGNTVKNMRPTERKKYINILKQRFGK